MIDTHKTVQLQATDRSELEARLRRGAERVVRATMRCVEAAGRMAHTHQDKVAAVTAKVAGSFDEKTHGRYTTKVGKVQQGVNHGVHKMAGYRNR